jgi:hypothetical protein
MKIELNIRLDVRNARNSIADCTKRAQKALDFLRLNFADVEARRFDTQLENDHSGEFELHQLLLARVTAGKSYSTDLDHKTIFNLAELLEQDCIAVYYPATNKGELIGPRMGDWVDGFDINKFVDFDEFYHTN